MIPIEQIEKEASELFDKIPASQLKHDSFEKCIQTVLEKYCSTFDETITGVAYGKD